MRRGRHDDDNDLEPEEEAKDEEEEDEEYRGRGKARRKRTRSNLIDDLAEEEEDDEEYGGGGQSRKRQKNRGLLNYFDEEAQVDSDGEEEEEEAEDDFVDDTGVDTPGNNDRGIHRRPLLPREDEQEDIEDLRRRIQERYQKTHDREYDEEATEVEQKALLPSFRDPKLWMVKCKIGLEREVAVCLMQKSIDKGHEMQIRSAIALDHLKNYIYIEADKKAHVEEAVKGIRNIERSKIILVPIKEMTDVLSVESKAIEVSQDTWVRIKTGTYKGDLGKVVNVDNGRENVKVKLIPRIDLQALANKLEGREVPKKKAFTPPARFMNVDEARELHIRVERKRDKDSGDYYDCIGDNMKFKDGFLYKRFSMKSISTLNVQPTFDELEKFTQPGETGDDTLFANGKKCHFMKGDRVVVVKGDLKNLKGSVEKVEEDTVHIKPHEKGLPKTLAISDRELCKYFEPGNHVKVVSGANEGATGMVVSVEGHVVNIVSDTTKDLLCVFADSVVESSEESSAITRIGDYELHDLVLMHDNSFGVIIQVESEAFQVLQGVPERQDVALVRLRDIKCKIDKKLSAKDRYNNTLSLKDVVKIWDGPCMGKQGAVEHIYRGVLFIYDRHHLEHAGLVCAKSESCVMVGGSRANGDRNGNSFASRFNRLRPPPRAPQNPMRIPRVGGRQRGGRGHDALVRTAIKIRGGHYKGCRGRVKEVKGSNVLVELESQMKVVTVDRSHVVPDEGNVSRPLRDMSNTSRYGMGSETPMHPCRTPLHPFMTPMRDAGATPIHDGMRTPMRDLAWNPSYTHTSPPRDHWDDANPASWGISLQYPAASPSRKYAPSPYLPSTPMTPGSGALDMMSPVVGADSEGPQFLPDILVNVHRSGEDKSLGVVQEVLPDGSCRVALGSGETVTILPSELEMVVPRKSDRIKIMGGAHRGAMGKLLGIDGAEGIIDVDGHISDVKILRMDILAKIAQT